MAVLTPAEKTIRAGELVGAAIEPFLAANAPAAGKLETWLAAFEVRDRDEGRGSVERDMSDVRVRLQILTRFWQDFRKQTKPNQTRWSNEILAALNRAAHVPSNVTNLDYVTFLGIARNLLLSLDGDEEFIAEVKRLAHDAMLDEVGSTHADLAVLARGATVEVAEAPAEADSPFDNSGPEVLSGSEFGEVFDAGPSASDNEPEGAAPAPPVLNLRNGVSAEAERAQTNAALARFEYHLQSSPWGLDYEFITVGTMRMVIFYRSDVNFALVHNRVSVLAGIGVYFDEPDSGRLTTDRAHCIAGISARLESLMDEEQYRWTISDIEVQSGEEWWAEPAHLAWNLPPTSFIGVDEARAESLTIEFSLDGQQVRRVIPLRVLAHDQWTPSTVPEIIAAFIRPRSEVVMELLSAASDLLGQRTGNPSLVGYQDSAERVHETVRAIYDAIVNAGIRYAEPPASFEDTGQKVRTSETVVRGQLGTCLDLTVLFAAALEEAGIQPFVLLLQGHSLVGFTTCEVVTESALSNEETISNLLGSGLFVPIETTAATAGKDISFDRAVNFGQASLEAKGGVRLVVNVQAAHRRMQPLPSIVDHEGTRTIVVVEDHVVRPRASTAMSYGSGKTRSLMAGEFPYRVQRWRSDLLDLTFRNPLLRLSDNRALNILLPGEDLGVLEDRLASGQTIRLLPHDEVNELDRNRGTASASQYTPATLSKLFHEEERTYVRASHGRTLTKLNSVRRTARSVREETGATVLFVSLGLLKWNSTGRASKQQAGRSPLFLLPVEFTGSATRPYAIRMEPNAEIEPNICLIEKLKQEYDLTLPQLEKPPIDESGIDLPRIFLELRQTFVERGLNFSIEAQAHLGVFQFASIDMWRDVSDNWETLCKNRMVEHLVQKPEDLFVSSVVSPSVAALDEVDLHLPLPADGTQVAAVKAASAGQTFVLEGPPGTGKSQTITNMIADGIARGRTILFVAEKQAALSVVKDRLMKVGLEPLVLEVHGKDQSLNNVRDQLKRAVQAQRTGNPSAFNAARRNLQHKIESLEGYPGLVHDRTPGESIWQRYQRVLALERGYPAGKGWCPEEIPVSAELRAADQAEVRRRVALVHAAAQRARGHRLPVEWAFVGAGNAGWPDARAEEAKGLIAAANALADAANRIPGPLARLYETSSTAQRAAIYRWLALLEGGHVVLPKDVAAPALSLNDVRRVQGDVMKFRGRWSQFGSILKPSAIDADADALLRGYEEALTAGLLKRSRLTKFALGKISAHVQIEDVAEVERDPLRFLVELKRFRSDHEALRHAVGQLIRGVGSVHLLSAETWDMLVAAERAAAIHEARVAATTALLAEAPNAADVLDRLVREDLEPAEAGDLRRLLEAFESACNDLFVRARSTRSTIDRWLGEVPLFVRIAQCAPRWNIPIIDEDEQIGFERVLRLHWALHALSEIGLSDAAIAIRDGHTTARLAEAAELAVTSDELERQLRVNDLDVFDPEERAALVGEYVVASRDIKRQLWNELPAALLEKRNSGTNISVGLRKEFDRKRGGSIRSLFTNYGSEILELTPVVLMSPAAVARFLPVNSVRFDTVIFDEASQVRVAEAIGALGRADAVVIVGDSKQMPPTSMFAGGGRTESDESSTSLTSTPAGAPDDRDALVLAAADQESVLSEAVGSGLERKWLSWHYRSRHEGLISFSNLRYYESNLQVFPGPPEARTSLGVSARFVDGVFDSGRSRTNEVEAKEIVEDITRRLDANPLASIGVVTFNTQQRDLILDLLEQSSESAVRESLERDDEPVFVKNLENVQGDERDVILFSLAFARDPESGQLRHNFGPLNNPGGERRLNVAITRARESVILYTSIRSADISPQRTRAEGVLHLKEYLAYAERGSRDVATATDRFAADDLYREDVAEQLRSVGLEVVTDVGTSRFRVDLGVRAGVRHGWLALTLDTPEWADRPIAADRDSLPREILEGVMGWHGTMQLLLPAWIRSKGAVVEQIKRRAEALQLLDGTEAVASLVTTARFGEELGGIEALSSPLTALPDAGAGDADQKRKETEILNPLAPVRDTLILEPRVAIDILDRSGEYDYTEASTEIVGEPEVLDNLRSNRNAARVKEVLVEILETEGPIEAQRLGRLVLSRFGIQRGRGSRIVQVLALAPRKPERDLIFGEFYWPEGLDSKTYTGYRLRAPGAGGMSVGEISHVEIANSIIGVLGDSGPMDRETVMHEVKGVFGWARLGSQIRERLTKVIERLLSECRLVEEGGELQLVLSPTTVDGV